MLRLEETVFCGEQAVLAENDELEMILVPGWGCNVVSLKSKRLGLELLRTPKSAEEFWSIPVLYGIPILFPPNRIENGVFSYNGMTYHFDINDPEEKIHSHGLVFAEKWKIVEKTKQGNSMVIQAEIDSTENPEIMRQFPHSFVLRMTFLLEGSSLTMKAAVINRGDRPFPWGLGYHTTFNFPFRNGDSLDNCLFSLTADRKWELNERFLPTGNLLDIPDKQQLVEGITLKDHVLDDVFMSTVATDGENAAVLEDKNCGVRIVYDCDENFKHWVIYNKDGKQGWLCPEPYTWVTNAPNLDLPNELTGLQEVGPGKQKEVRCTIRVEI